MVKKEHCAEKYTSTTPWFTESNVEIIIDFFSGLSEFSRINLIILLYHSLRLILWAEIIKGVNYAAGAGNFPSGWSSPVIWATLLRWSRRETGNSGTEEAGPWNPDRTRVVRESIFYPSQLFPGCMRDQGEISCLVFSRNIRTVYQDPLWDKSSECL